MAITVHINFPSMNAGQYDETIKRLEQAGAGAPQGRIAHICYGTGSNLQVMDVWASQEEFNAFGATLMPILQQVSIEPAPPEIFEVHNTIFG